MLEHFDTRRKPATGCAQALGGGYQEKVAAKNSL